MNSSHQAQGHLNTFLDTLGHLCNFKFFTFYNNIYSDVYIFLFVDFTHRPVKIRVLIYLNTFTDNITFFIFL